MLSVHGGIVGGDGSVFEEVELVSVGRCGKYSCVAPVNVVLHVVAMFGRGGFYVANRVCKIVESVTCFVLLNPFDNRSAGLSNVVIFTVLAVLSQYARRLSFLLTKAIAAQNGVALSYHRVRGCIFWQLFLRLL